MTVDLAKLEASLINAEAMPPVEDEEYPHHRRR
jgi:hypothetical protein